MPKEKVVFVWSGGKDSSLALHRLRADPRYEVVSLLTTCNEHFQRVSMHGVRLDLIDRQADAIGLPLEKMFVSERSSNEEYLERLTAALTAHKERGVTTFAFGDIFLEDLRRWREENLARLGLRAIFPLWKVDTRELIAEFISFGFGAIVCCIDDAYLDESFVGRTIDKTFIDSLPADVDPCGEYGEFHSFAFAGPIFKAPIAVSLGEKVYRPIEVTHPDDKTPAPVCTPPGARRRAKGFWFCDLLAADSAGRALSQA